MEKYAFSKLDNTIGYSKANLSEIVVSHIKNKILAGDLKSGDKIIETDLSDELQISRAPIREAMRELNMQGILSFSPRKGSQIVDMTYDDISEIFSIRIPLEMQVLTIIFEKSLMKDEDMDYLDGINRNMMASDNKEMDQREELYELNRNDLSFHSFFWDKCGSTRRAHILENQYFQLITAMNQDPSTLGSKQEKFNEHKKIIDACRSGSLEEILEAFKNHMNSYLEVITSL